MAESDFTAVADEDRMPVGRRLGHHVGSDAAAHPRPVFHDELLAEAFGELRRADARQDIRIAARHEPDQDAHRFLRIGQSLRKSNPVPEDRDQDQQANRHQCSSGSKLSKAATCLARSSPGDAGYSKRTGPPQIFMQKNLS